MTIKDINMWTCARIVQQAIGCAAVLAGTPLVAAQSAPAHSATSASEAVVLKPGVTTPADFVIGPDDHLSVIFWRDRDLTADVVVRPDGKISLPLLNDIQAAGLTPEQLRQAITEGAKRYVEDPTASVVVQVINSRRVFITGEVQRPGPYPLIAPTTVLQLIATAGGLKEYANGGKIVIMRMEKDQQVGYSFNYKDVINRKNMKQNIELKPGDTVIVP
jgi:polysaccharide export outer membrane protein